MTNARKRPAAVIIIILLAAALLCAFSSPGFRGGIANALDDDDGMLLTYYNEWAQTDADPDNNFNFSGDDKNGRNPYEAAEKAVKDGKNKTVRGYIFAKKKDGTLKGELIRRTNPHDGSEKWDPALLAALCVDAENKTKVVILTDEQSEPLARRADAAHLHFLKDRDYAEACYDKLAKIWSSAGNVYVDGINDYTSSMYMWNDGLQGDKPAVIVRDSQNAGGHVIVFDLGKAGVLRYRIECGFQPIDLEYWPTPDAPKIKDNPEPVPDKPEKPDEPEPEKYLEPKNPDDGYQKKHPDNPDVGGGPNHNNDTTPTKNPNPKKNSPDKYEAPDPPKDESKSDKPSTKTDASKDTKSGSKTVDNDNGKKETYKDPDTGKESSGTVVAGDGKDHGDFSKKVDEKPATKEKGADPKPSQSNPNPGNDECDAPE